MARFTPKAEDMKAAATMLHTLAAPLGEPVHVQLNRAGSIAVRFDPYLADLLRELFAYIARGEAVTIMNFGPHVPEPERIDTFVEADDGQ